jgi:hypothetical protein
MWVASDQGNRHAGTSQHASEETAHRAGADYSYCGEAALPGYHFASWRYLSKAAATGQPQSGSRYLCAPRRVNPGLNVASLDIFKRAGRRGGAASSEFVPVDAHGRHSVRGPDNATLEDQIERYALVEAGRPLHRNQNMLPGLQSSVVLEKQAITADINGFCRRRTVTRGRIERPVTECEPQWKAHTRSTFDSRLSDSILCQNGTSFGKLYKKQSPPGSNYMKNICCPAY